TYGEQVLMPGATATEALSGTNLGLAVILIGEKGTAAQDSDNRLIRFALKDGTASWYVAAAWDQEGTEDRVSAGKPNDMRRFVEPENPDGQITSQAQFIDGVKNQAARLGSPVSVKIVSRKAEPQSAPPDTLAFASHKTYAQAVDLLRQE